jgi:hypothetical protein
VQADVCIWCSSATALQTTTSGLLLVPRTGRSLHHMPPQGYKDAQLRQPKTLAQQINHIWSMDFVADNLFDGHNLSMLPVVDCYYGKGWPYTLA